jgi:hypothetical protein
MKLVQNGSHGGGEPLAKLVGEELSAITFVRDYLQLHFDGPTINAYTLPIVTFRDSRWANGDTGYKDAICARIGVAVIGASTVPEDRLQLDFADGASVAISLRPEHRVIAEAAMYTDPQTNEWACW